MKWTGAPFDIASIRLTTTDSITNRNTFRGQGWRVNLFY